MIFPINFELIIKTETEEADETDEDLQQGTEDHTECHTHDTTLENLYTKEINTISKNCDADENTDIIERRSERIKDETSDRLLNGVQNRGYTKEKRINRDHTRHIDGENSAGFIEARTDNVANQRVRKNHNKNTGDKGNESHEIESGSGKFPGRFFIAGRKTLIKNWDKTDSESTRSKDEEHKIWNGESSSIGIHTSWISIEIVRIEQAVTEDTEQCGNQSGDA